MSDDREAVKAFARGMTSPPARRVLVTEDDPALRRLLATAIRRGGVELQTAVDGEEALNRLVEREWLVLVLDMMMPKVSGWDVIGWLAKHPERKPKTVIVVSAADRALLKKLDPSVVNAIIFKPLDVFQLAAYVKSACDLHHQDRRRKRLVSEAHAVE
ncbi:MAG TPA: response regulator [Thermoanaerobaculia bacterium]